MKKQSKIISKLENLFAARNFSKIVKIHAHQGSAFSSLENKEKSIALQIFGGSYKAKGKVEQASELLELSFKCDNDNIRVLYDLLSVYVDRKEHDKVVHAATILINKMKDQIHYSAVNKGIDACIAIGDVKTAFAWCDFTNKVHPQNTEAKVKAADLYLATRQFEKAKQVYKKLFDSDPENIFLTSRFVNSLINNRDYKDAKRTIEKTKYRNHAVFMWAESVIEIELGNYLHSISLSERILSQYLNDDNVFKDFRFASKSKPNSNLTLVLENTSKLLNELNVSHFLCCGTLLGIYRDGKLLKNDKDLDIALPWLTDRAKLKEELEKKGYLYYSGDSDVWVNTYVHQSTGVPVDFFFVNRHEQSLYIGTDSEVTWKHQAFKLSDINVNGVTYKVPASTELYLEELYGENWKIPQHFDPTIGSPSLTNPQHTSVHARGLNKLLDVIQNGRWQKAFSLVKQLSTHFHSELLSQLQFVIEKKKEDYSDVE